MPPKKPDRKSPSGELLFFARGAAGHKGRARAALSLSARGKRLLVRWGNRIVGRIDLDDGPGMGSTEGDTGEAGRE